MKTVFFTLAILLSLPTAADSFKTEEEIRGFSDKLIDTMVQADFKKGFDSTKPFWPLPEVEIDSITNQMNQQWPLIDQRFGKATGKEFLKEERIGSSFIRYYYLHKFEKHAMYWQLDFYRAEKEWKINRIITLDTLDILFE